MLPPSNGAAATSTFASVAYQTLLNTARPRRARPRPPQQLTATAPPRARPPALLLRRTCAA